MNLRVTWPIFIPQKPTSLLTVQSNDFFKFNDFNFEHVSVFSVNGSSGPSQNRIVVYNNDFLTSMKAAAWT